MAKLELDPAALWWCQPDPDEDEGETPRGRRVRGLKEAADMDVARFIAEVRAREPLYNTACAQYGERALKAKMWKEVASIMKLSLHTCKAKWKSIRDSYVRELRRQERLAARGVDVSHSRKRPYVHFEQLAFLAPTLHKAGGQHTLSLDWKMECSDDETACGPGTVSGGDDTPEGEDSGLPSLLPAPEVVVESVTSLSGQCGGGGSAGGAGEVLHTICSPIGQVLRIVIFKKNGVQAMVEFDSVESAKRAKESLNGADIYSGCCTLKIDYAKPNKLNVYKNDSESWDYTNPNMGSKEAPPAGRPAPLLQEPRYGAGPQPYRDGMRGGGVPPYGPAPPDRYDDGYQNGPGGGSYPDHYGDRYQPADRYGMKSEYGGREPLHPTPPGRPGYGPPALAQTPGGPSPPVSQQGSVMMVYGLDMEKVNTDKLFNLFCLYGNVVRIKFLKTKEGCAMIQMGDGLAVERCVQNLNNVPLLGSKLQLGFSKQAFLSDVQNPYPLPDKTPSFKDFMGNKNNRFINPSMASKNRIQPPSKILHFFNTPPNITEEMLSKVFEENNVPVPKTVKLFPLKTDRSSSGLLEFDDISAAVEALMMCNHLPIHNPAGGKFPYIMKLCFSSSRQIPTSLRGGNESGGGSQQSQQSQDGMMKQEMQTDNMQ